MQSEDTNKSTFQPPPDLELKTPRRNNKFERTSWMNWFLLTGGGFITIFWLAGTTIILLGNNGFSMDRMWPPSGPYIAMGIAVVYLFFGLHLTYHQYQLDNSRKARSRDRMMSILSVSRTLGAADDPQTVFDCVTSVCRSTYDCDQVSLMLLDRPSSMLEVRSVSGHLNPSEVLGLRTDMGQGVAGWVAQRREPVVLGAKIDRSTFKNFKSKEYTISSAMVVPIILGDEVFGVLSVTSRTENVGYTQEDLQSLQILGEHAGICARHTEKARGTRDAA